MNTWIQTVVYLAVLGEELMKVNAGLHKANRSLMRTRAEIINKQTKKIADLTESKLESKAKQ